MIHTWDWGYVANPMDPVEVRSLLEVGGLYEFEHTLGNETISWLMLGILRSSGEDALFDVLAGEIPTIASVSIYMGRFRSLKRVSLEELPLYIGWRWKSDKFIWMLKGDTI